jgi:hypothetical protein
VSHEAHVARPFSDPGLREIAVGLLVLRRLWRLAGFVLLTSAIAVVHVAVRLQSDSARRELAMIEAQAAVAESWRHALELDLETRRSGERLEQAAASIGASRPDQITRIVLRESP